MNGFGFLLSILFLLYVLECATYIPVGTVAFRLPSNKKSNLQLLTKLGAVPRPAIALSYPMSFRSAIIVCSSVPVSISPGGIVSGTLDEFVAFEDMSRIEASRQSVFINGRAHISASSEKQASSLAELLTCLCKEEPANRERRIEKYIGKTLDADTAGAKIREYMDQSFVLNLDSLVLFLITFVFSPLVVWRFGLLRTWPLLLLCLLLNVCLILWDFHRVERRLFPESGTKHWEAMVTILLSPPSALCASKYLARDIAAQYHPLAIAAYRCSDEDFDTLGAWILRQLMFIPDTGGTTYDRAGDCKEWFRREYLKQASALVRLKGRQPEFLVAPPPRKSQRVESYCPRCHTQYVVSKGTCFDCGGVALRSFDQRL